jgi:hypothetical protein
MAAKAKKSKSVTMTMTKDKDTKTMKRFVEDGNEDRPISLYLRNDQVEAMGADESIEVTITSA